MSYPPNPEVISFRCDLTPALTPVPGPRPSLPSSPQYQNWAPRRPPPPGCRQSSCSTSRRCWDTPSTPPVTRRARVSRCVLCRRENTGPPRHLQRTPLLLVSFFSNQVTVLALHQSVWPRELCSHWPGLVTEAGGVGTVPPQAAWAQNKTGMVPTKEAGVPLGFQEKGEHMLGR